MAKKKKKETDPLTVSEARARLFDLVEQVAENPDEPVRIEHRNKGQQAVLVNAERYDYLLQAGYGVMRVQERPFRLFGSMQLGVPEDEFDAWLDENRRAQADLAARKLDEL